MINRNNRPLYSLNELEKRLKRERKAKRKAERKATMEEVIYLGLVIICLWAFSACVYSF